MLRVLEKPPKKITSAQMEPPSLERKLRGIYILSTLSKFCATAISMMQLDIFGQRLQPHHSGNSHLNVYLFYAPPPPPKKKMTNLWTFHFPFPICRCDILCWMIWHRKYYQKKREMWRAYLLQSCWKGLWAISAFVIKLWSFIILKSL